MAWYARRPDVRPKAKHATPRIAKDAQIRESLLQRVLKLHRSAGKSVQWLKGTLNNLTHAMAEQDAAFSGGVVKPLTRAEKDGLQLSTKSSAFLKGVANTPAGKAMLGHLANAGSAGVAQLNTFFQWVGLSAKLIAAHAAGWALSAALTAPGAPAVNRYGMPARQPGRRVVRNLFPGDHYMLRRLN